MYDLHTIFPNYGTRLQRQISLKKYSWFRCGGKADWLFLPENEADLVYFLHHIPRDIPVTLIGLASNVIIRENGIEGVVIRLGRGFGTISHTPQGCIDVGASVPVARLAKYATEHSIGGLQFYRGIPGSVGGALVMNAGAYGQETKHVLKTARYVKCDGSVHTISVQDLGYSYRHCKIYTSDMVFVGGIFQGKGQGDRLSLEKEMQTYMDKREETQPIKEKTGGSTFKNPPQHSAWKLIEAAGCRGLSVGGAKMSELHCNFMINYNEATATDLEMLGEEVRKRVFAHSGIELEWEIKRIGRC